MDRNGWRAPWLLEVPPLALKEGVALDSLTKVKDKDLDELSRVLEAMELEFRSSLTITRVVRWLAWRKGLGPNSHRLFSPLSDKVCMHGYHQTLLVKPAMHDSDRHVGIGHMPTGIHR